MNKLSKKAQDLRDEQLEEIHRLLDEREVYSLVTEDEEDFDGYLTDDVDTDDFAYVHILIDDRTDSWVLGRVFEIGKTDVRYTGGAYLRYISDDEYGYDSDMEIHDCFLIDVSNRDYDRLLDMMEVVKERDV